MAQTGLQRDPADEAFLAPLMAQRAMRWESRHSTRPPTSGRALGYEEAIAEVRAWLEACALIDRSPIP